MVIASLVLASLLITTGVVFALGMGAVNQGTNSTAEGDFSTVGGGRFNNASGGDFAEFDSNTASGFESTVGGGFRNKAIGEGSTVSGGGDFDEGCQCPGNTAEGDLATVGGGTKNSASDFASTVAGGDANAASGSHSTVPGGALNNAAGDYALAAGFRAKANHQGTFVWADSTGQDFASTGANQFLIRAAGGVGIGTNSPNQLLVVGDSFASSTSGKRVTIGNKSGGPDLILGKIIIKELLFCGSTKTTIWNWGLSVAEATMAIPWLPRPVESALAQPLRRNDFMSMAMCGLISS
jgi:hypothetical protein